MAYGDQLFTYAGISLHDGEYTFRVTNREIYDTLLERAGDTHVNIVPLPEEMNRLQARDYLLRHKEFKNQQIQKALRNWEAPEGTLWSHLDEEPPMKRPVGRPRKELEIVEAATSTRAKQSSQGIPPVRARGRPRKVAA